MKHSAKLMSLVMPLSLTTEIVPVALAQTPPAQELQNTHSRAKGAAAGAAIGAVSGNAAKGAAAGAVVGGMHHRHEVARQEGPTGRPQ